MRGRKLVNRGFHEIITSQFSVFASGAMDPGWYLLLRGEFLEDYCRGLRGGRKGRRGDTIGIADKDVESTIIRAP